VNSLKSGVVLLVMVGVLYGVYIVLSKPEPLASDRTAEAGPDIQAPQIEFGVTGGPAGDAPQLAVESSSPTSPPGFATPAATNSAPALNPPSAYASPPPGFPSSVPGASENAPPAPEPSAYATNSAPPSAYSAESAADDHPYRRSSYESPAASAAAPSTASHDSSSAYNTSVSDNRAPTASPAHTPNPALAAYAVRQALGQAETLVAANKFKEALATLSPYYTSPEVTDDQRPALLPWLDALAAKVIYSKEHLLDMPYETRGKETLYDIAARFHVPPQLLHNINRDVVSDPDLVVPGTQLKVVPGPLRAEIDLAHGELILFLNNLYAGRFPISLGNEPAQPGVYKVIDKRRDRTYYGADGRTISADDPANPYGGVWIDLGHDVTIHGSPTVGPQGLGCISLSPQDAQDVYGILSLQSEVIVR
jgi:hypothetical protein